MCKLDRLTIFLLLILITNSENAQFYNNWTKEKANQWCSSRIWAKGLNLQLYSGVNTIAFATQYYKNPKAWEKAFGYLTNYHLDTISAGKACM